MAEAYYNEMKGDTEMKESKNVKTVTADMTLLL